MSNHRLSTPIADMSDEGDSGRDTVKLVVVCAVVLVALNAVRYATMGRASTWIPAFLVLGTLAYIAILRITTGTRFGDLSAQGRFVIVSATALLALFIAFGRSGTYMRHLSGFAPPSALSSLYPFFYFVACGLIARTFVPLLFIRTTLRSRPADYGYAIRVESKSKVRWIYLALFAVMVPLIIWASARPDFQASYPQAKGATHQDIIPLTIFVAYHCAYLLLFLSGESFWRGYMTFGLGRDLGIRALPWMVMLYSISHYGKPFLEVNGAIIAGIVLGYLALKHGSFWLGVLLHWSIALTMDLSVIVRTGIVLQ